jgi:hypothetical protein
MGNVKVNLADLRGEKESLAKFLLKHFKLNSSPNTEGLELNDEVLSYALAKMVNKFLYSKRLNLTHWVSVENNVVKINKFNFKKEKKNKHPVTASTIRHGW